MRCCEGRVLLRAVKAVKLRVESVNGASKKLFRRLYRSRARCSLQSLQGRCEVVSLCSHELRVASARPFLHARFLILTHSDHPVEQAATSSQATLQLYI
jgi:hypothetical protein